MSSEGEAVNSTGNLQSRRREQDRWDKGRPLPEGTDPGPTDLLDSSSWGQGSPAGCWATTLLAHPAQEDTCPSGDRKSHVSAVMGGSRPSTTQAEPSET